MCGQCDPQNKLEIHEYGSKSTAVGHPKEDGSKSPAVVPLAVKKLHHTHTRSQLMGLVIIPKGHHQLI